MRGLWGACLAFTLLSACGNRHDDPNDLGMDLGTNDSADLATSDLAPDMRLLGGSCEKNEDCLKSEYCTWAPEHACGNDQTPGVCTPINRDGCGFSLFSVCACNGSTYPNECISLNYYQAPVAYGGTCRSGEHHSCVAPADCVQDLPFTQNVCVDDPSDGCFPQPVDDGGTDGGSADGGTRACPGLCAHASTRCSTAHKCDSERYDSPEASPGTQNCIASFDSPDEGWCVFTTRVSCQSSSDCTLPEVCLPLIGCDPTAGAPCPSVCVRL
jgi:hypothetical protein